MGRFLDLALLLFGFYAASGWAQAGINVNEEVQDPAKSPALAVTASASFENAEIFGIKLVNGNPTNVKISFVNEEPEPVSVQFVGGSLWTPDFDVSGSRLVRNLTTRQYGVEVPAGEKQTIPFSFQTNMHPQELRLNLAAVVNMDRAFYTVQIFNGTVAVVEPDSSIFDPQIIFLYLFLLACTGGVGYFFYNIWIAPYFPQKKRGGAPKKAVVPKKIDAGGDVDGADGPATSTGAKTYNDEWIPASHLQKSEARRVKSSGRPKSRQGKE